MGEPVCMLLGFQLELAWSSRLKVSKFDPGWEAR
jgi:hypothetical protein